MVKTPKQLYIVSRPQDAGQPALGFLSGYEPGKSAFVKKRETQFGWAYSGPYGIRWGSYSNPEDVNGVVWITKREYFEQIDPVTNRILPPKIVTTREIADCQPQIWDNTPMSGFTITKSVSRYSTSNKLWRILDPRNIEFEITTACLEDIILKSTIKNGVIQDPCVWVTSKNLIVV